MDWKTAVNRGLTRTTGLQLVRAGTQPTQPAPVAPTKRAPVQRPPVDRSPRELVRPAAHPDVDRLVHRPVFVMSPVRSGSTLLRSMLNAHSMLHAPHELHVRRLRVQTTTSMAASSMKLLGYNEADLEHLLWDRVLHRELVLSGKRYIVEKTPSNSFVFKRIATCWPDARFIFLLRHPASIAASWSEVTKWKWTPAQATENALDYMRATNRARTNLTGLTVRYEDLTADPEAVTKEICGFLEIPWEEGMLAYGGDEKYVKGLGDWSKAIRSGTVQPGRALPGVEEIPTVLRPMSRRWGYLDGETAGSAADQA